MLNVSPCPTPCELSQLLLLSRSLSQGLQLTHRVMTIASQAAKCINNMMLSIRGNFLVKLTLKIPPNVSMKTESIVGNHCVLMVGESGW